MKAYQGSKPRRLIGPSYYCDYCDYGSTYRPPQAIVFGTGTGVLVRSIGVLNQGTPPFLAGPLPRPQPRRLAEKETGYPLYRYVIGLSTKMDYV